MKKIRVMPVLLALLFASFGLSAAGQTVYKGKLIPELTPSNNLYYRMNVATPEVIALLPSAPAPDDLVYATKLTKDNQLVLVAPKKAAKYLYIDMNRDGKFEESERFTFNERGELEVKLPVSAGFFQAVPMKFSAQGSLDSFNVVPYSVANGMVDIGGRMTLVQYDLNMDSKTIDPTRGQVLVDCNGDGKLNRLTNNPERASGKGTPIVFRVGTHYVVTKSVNVNTGEIVMEERPASEYKRIELAKGTQVPDFSFKDIDGKPHKLSDFRGKYLLLDFWGSW